MTLFRTIEPAAEPVTLAQVKAHLRISDSGEDELLAELVRGAREEVERSTGLALIDQSWRLVLDRLPRHATVTLPRHPVRAVTSVTVYGTDGEATLVPGSDYQLDPLSRPARLHFEKPPTATQRMNGIEVDFSAGFGEAGTDVPDTLKRALILLVAHWYEFRAQVEPGDHPVSHPATYERLIAPYRVRRL